MSAPASPLRRGLIALISAGAVAGLLAFGASVAHANLSTCAAVNPGAEGVYHTAAWDPAFPDEIVAQICVSRGTATNASLTLTIDRGSFETVAVDPLGSEGGIYVGAKSAKLELRSASPGPGQTVGLSMRLRVVTKNYFSEPEPLITAKSSFIATFDEGALPTRLVRTPVQAVPSYGVLPRPVCSLTNRQDSLRVLTPALGLAQLTYSGVVTKVRLCPGEMVMGSLYPPNAVFDANGRAVGAPVPRIGLSFSSLLYEQETAFDLDVRAGSQALAGLDRVKLLLVVSPFQTHPFPLTPSALAPIVTKEQIITLLGAPLPLRAPALKVHRTSLGASVAIRMGLDTSLIGRRAIIERRVGPRFVRLGTTRVTAQGVVARTFLFRRDREKGALGIRTAKTVRIRVRLERRGVTRAVGGTPATIRLP